MEDAVLVAVVAEDVGEAGSDDAPEAVVEQRPGGVLPRRPGAEVPAGDQDGHALIPGLVQDEVRVWPTVLQEAPVEEQELAEPRSLDPLQELLGYDLVRVDVHPVQGRGDAGVCHKRFH